MSQEPLFPREGRFLTELECFLKSRVSFPSFSFKGHQDLLHSLKYSLLKKGKRFRPLLCLSVARLWDVPVSGILPWAGAVEMIHTASLILDDLPVMDAGLKRRGQASNHRRFGEQTALLSVQALWTQAFQTLTLHPPGTVPWLKILCQRSGFQGLVGGQALDLRPPLEKTASYFSRLNEMKTASLICATLEGVAALKKPSRQAGEKARRVGTLLGRAFQLADDLQDFHRDRQCGRVNEVQVLGRPGAIKKLHHLTEKTLTGMQAENKPLGLFKDLVLFNQNRGDMC